MLSTDLVSEEMMLIEDGRKTKRHPEKWSYTVDYAGGPKFLSKTMEEVFPIYFFPPPLSPK